MGRILGFFLKTTQHIRDRRSTFFVSLCSALLVSLFTSGCGPGVDLIRPRSSLFNSEPKAPRYELKFVQAPSQGVAGTPWADQPEVWVQDEQGQRVTSLKGSVTLSIIEGPSDGGISGMTTHPLNDGVAQFAGLWIERSGFYRLRASAPGAVDAEIFGLSIGPANAEKIQLDTQPETQANAGEVLKSALKVSLRDAFGNVAMDQTPTVSLSAFTDEECSHSAPDTSKGYPALKYGSDPAMVAEGEAEFSAIQFFLTGVLYLKVEALGFSPLCSNKIEVQPAAPRYTLIGLPPILTSGTAENLSLVSKDEFGNRVPYRFEEIAFEIFSSSNGGRGTFSEPSLSEDVAMTTFIPKAAGDFSIVAKVEGETVSEVSGMILPGTPTKLAFVSFSSSGIWGFANQNLSEIHLEVLDSAGNRVTNYSGSISVQLNDASSSNLTGTLSVPVRFGLATFSDLKIDQKGPYELKATSDGLQEATEVVQIYSPLQISPRHWVGRKADLLTLQDFIPSEGSGSFDFSLRSAQTIGFSSAVINPTNGKLNLGALDNDRGRLAIRVTDLVTSASVDSTVHSVTPQFNGAVRAMLVSGDDAYFAGDFTAYQPRLMNGLGKFRRTDSKLENQAVCNFAGLLGSGDEVYSMVHDSVSGALYVGGKLSSYAGVNVSGLIKIDFETCARDESSHPVTGEGVIKALALNEQHLYGGGNFESGSCSHLCRWDLANGDLSLNFNFSLDGQVNALRLTSDALFVGGAFTGGFKKINLKASGATLNPPVIDQNFGSFNGEVLALAGPAETSAGATVIFVAHNGLSYTRPGAQAQAVTGLIALKTGMNSGASGSYAPASIVSLAKGAVFREFNFDSTVGWPNALEVVGPKLYLGGDFTGYLGSNKNYLIRFDTASGDLDHSFAPTLSGPVLTMTSVSLADNKKRLYVGGVGYVALISHDMGLLESFLNESTIGFNDGVRALLLTSEHLMVGGRFSTFGGMPASHIAKVTLSTGALDSQFTQNVGTNGQINALAILDNALYLGGAFHEIGSLETRQSAHYLAKVTLSTGALDTQFTLGGTFGLTGPVLALAASNQALYVGGSFSEITETVLQNGSPDRVRVPVGPLVKLNPTSGNRDPSFSFHPSDAVRVNAIALSGADLFVGGLFEKALKKINASTGAENAFFSGTTSLVMNSGVPVVHSLALSSDGIFVGGNFSGVSNNGVVTNSQNLTKLSLNSGIPSGTFNISSIPLSLAVVETFMNPGPAQATGDVAPFLLTQKIYVGYENALDPHLGGVAEFDGLTSTQSLFSAQTNGGVRVIVPQGSELSTTLLVGGNFMQAGGSTDLNSNVLNAFGHALTLHPTSK